MAYDIHCTDMDQANLVVKTLNDYMSRSRFTIGITGSYGNPGGITIEHRTKTRVVVAIRAVRLKQKKDNCGNHCGPCRLTWKPHKKATTLEGLDWVSFNDMVNDALDSINHRGNVASTACIVRKAGKRRMGYFGNPGFDFDKDTDHYSDYCELPSPGASDHECGTPGIVGWSIECVEPEYVDSH